MVKRTGPKIEPCGTPETTACGSDNVPLYNVHVFVLTVYMYPISRSLVQKRSGSSMNPGNATLFSTGSVMLPNV